MVIGKVLGIFAADNLIAHRRKMRMGKLSLMATLAATASLGRARYRILQAGRVVVVVAYYSAAGYKFGVVIST